MEVRKAKPELAPNFIFFPLEIENYVFNILVRVVTVGVGLYLLNCRCQSSVHLLCKFSRFLSNPQRTNPPTYLRCMF